MFDHAYVKSKTHYPVAVIFELTDNIGWVSLEARKLQKK